MEWTEGGGGWVVVVEGVGVLLPKWEHALIHGRLPARLPQGRCQNDSVSQQSQFTLSCGVRTGLLATSEKILKVAVILVLVLCTRLSVVTSASHPSNVLRNSRS